MSSILSGVNVIVSMILIWVQDNKHKLPDPIHKFIFQRLSKLLGIEARDVTKAFLFQNEMLNIWNESQMIKKKSKKEIPDFETDQVQQQNIDVANLLKTINNTLETKLEGIQYVFEAKLEGIHSLLNEYFVKRCKDDSKEEHLMATIMNRLFGYLAVILNVGLLLYSIICYLFGSNK